MFVSCDKCGLRFSDKIDYLKHKCNLSKYDNWESFYEKYLDNCSRELFKDESVKDCHDVPKSTSPNWKVASAETHKLYHPHAQRRKTKSANATISSYRNLPYRNINPDFSHEFNPRQIGTPSPNNIPDCEFDKSVREPCESSQTFTLQTQDLQQNEIFPNSENVEHSPIKRNLNSTELNIFSYYNTPRKRSSSGTMESNLPNKRTSLSPNISTQIPNSEKTNYEIESVLPKVSGYQSDLLYNDKYDNISSPDHELEEENVSRSSTLSIMEPYKTESSSPTISPNKHNLSPKSLWLSKHNSQISAATIISSAYTSPSTIIKDEFKSPSPGPQYKRSFSHNALIQSPDEFKSPYPLQKTQSPIAKATDEFKSPSPSKRRTDWIQSPSSTATGANCIHSPSPSKTQSSLRETHQHTRSLSQSTLEDSGLHSCIYAYHFRPPTYYQSQSETQSSSIEIPIQHETSRPESDWRIMYYCQFCDIAFGDPAMFKVHKEFHSNHNPFECSLCKNVYTNKLDFLVHFTSVPHQYPIQRF